MPSKYPLGRGAGIGTDYDFWDSTSASKKDKTKNRGNTAEDTPKIEKRLKGPFGAYIEPEPEPDIRKSSTDSIKTVGTNDEEPSPPPPELAQPNEWDLFVDSFVTANGKKKEERNDEKPESAITGEWDAFADELAAIVHDRDKNKKDSEKLVTPAEPIISPSRVPVIPDDEANGGLDQYVPPAEHDQNDEFVSHGGDVRHREHDRNDIYEEEKRKYTQGEHDQDDKNREQDQDETHVEYAQSATRLEDDESESAYRREENVTKLEKPVEQTNVPANNLPKEMEYRLIQQRPSSLSALGQDGVESHAVTSHRRVEQDKGGTHVVMSQRRLGQDDTGSRTVTVRRRYPEPGSKSREMVVYKQYTGVTEVGLPTALIIAKTGAHNHALHDGGNTPRHESYQLNNAIDALRSNIRSIEFPEPDGADENEQQPGILVSSLVSKPLPLAYIPVEKFSSGLAVHVPSAKPSAVRNEVQNGKASTRSTRGKHINPEDLYSIPKQQETPNPTPKVPKYEPSPKIHTPPFLSWATRRNPGFRTNAEISRTSTEHIERILESIHTTLGENRLSRNRKVYRISLELCRNELEKIYPFLNDIKVSTQRQTRTSGKDESSTSGESHLVMDNFGVGMIDTHDRIHVELMRKCIDANTKLLRSFQTFISYYLSLSSNHSVVQKCWGAFHTILSVSTFLYIHLKSHN
jgi:hypothetical protein